MRERNSQGESGAINEGTTNPRKIKEYQAHITIGYKQPPVQEVTIKARSFAEATSKALELGRQFIQADVLNSFGDMGEQIVEELNKGNVKKASEIYRNHGIQHDDFDIDGIVITRKDIMETKVLAEDEVAKKMHTDIENFLQTNTQEEE
jgi:hypothetical protein